MNRKPDDKGFTLLELLTVIAIIGVLAAIAASYMKNSRQSALDISAKHDLKEFMIAQEAYYNDYRRYMGDVGQSTRNDGIPSDFTVGGLTPSPGVIITVTAGDPADPYDAANPFTVESRHTSSTKKYVFDTAANLISEN